MRQNLKLIPALVIFGVFTAIGFTNCSVVTFGGLGTGATIKGTEVVNPLTSSLKIAQQMCSKISSCQPSANFSTCVSAVMSLGGIASGLGLSDSTYPSLNSVSDAESSGAISANSSSAIACSSSVADLSCSSPQVTAAFNPKAANPFALAGDLLVANSCAATFGAPTIFRSVGPGNTKPLATGGSNSVTISNANATFTTSLPDNVGVGDAIQYQVGSTWSIAFITSRSSSIAYVLQTASGGTPSPTSGNTTWSIYRAYTSFKNALNGTENTGINAAVQNFDTWTTGRDMVENNEKWNFAFYADAPESITTGVNIMTNWTSDSTHYVQFFTPYLPNQVGVSQRHNGILNATGYSLTVNMAISNDGLFFGNNESARIDGLQINFISSNTSVSGIGAIHIIPNAGGSDVRISNCLIHTSNPGPPAAVFAIFIQGPGQNTYRIWNNISINTGPRSGYGIYSDSTATIYASNNTVSNYETGYAQNNTVQFVAKNNIIQGASTAFAGSFTASDYNLANDGTTTGGTHDLVNKTVTFANQAAGNFLLSLTDTSARGAGVDLTTDANNPFSADILGITRTGPWDLGASRAQ